MEKGRRRRDVIPSHLPHMTLLAKVALTLSQTDSCNARLAMQLGKNCTALQFGYPEQDSINLEGPNNAHVKCDAAEGECTIVTSTQGINMRLIIFIGNAQQTKFHKNSFLILHNHHHQWR